MLARNPSIEAMTSSWQAAQNRIEQVSSLNDPMLSYSFAPETRNLKDQDLSQVIVDGAGRRIRPMLMTGMALLMGLIPILWRMVPVRM